MSDVRHVILCDDLPYGWKDLLLDIARIPSFIFFLTILVSVHVLVMILIAIDYLSEKLV